MKKVTWLTTLCLLLTFSSNLFSQGIVERNYYTNSGQSPKRGKHGNRGVANAAASGRRIGITTAEIAAGAVAAVIITGIAVLVSTGSDAH